MSLAAAFSDLDIEYLPGVSDLHPKAMPPGGRDAGLSAANMGNWRSHVNAALKVVEENLTSVLVLEDDADWDIRIKSQMHTFARASQLLVQPVPGTPPRYLDPSYPTRRDGQVPHHLQLDADTTATPTTSPYGDVNQWDFLWLGHCGATLPSPEQEIDIPMARVDILGDETVPEKQHYKPEFGGPELMTEYPAHTRVVSRGYKMTCLLAYALSQRGARKILYELGVKQMVSTTDAMYRDMCEGSYGRTRLDCVTVHPQLFQHHRAAGPRTGFSDIDTFETHDNNHAFTMNVRQSVRVNFERLMLGRTDYIDQYPDGEDAVFDKGA